MQYYKKYRVYVSSQVKWAKFRHKVYQAQGRFSPQSIPAEKLVSNGLVVLQPVAGAGHVNNLAAVDETVKDIVGYGLILVGYQDLPKVGDPLTPGIFWLTMFLFFGMPILGWVASLIAMKFYPLDKEKMEEVQLKIADIKAQERAR